MLRAGSCYLTWAYYSVTWGGFVGNFGVAFPGLLVGGLWVDCGGFLVYLLGGCVATL